MSQMIRSKFPLTGPSPGQSASLPTFGVFMENMSPPTKSTNRGSAPEGVDAQVSRSRREGRLHAIRKEKKFNRSELQRRRVPTGNVAMTAGGGEGTAGVVEDFESADSLGGLTIPTSYAFTAGASAAYPYAIALPDAALNPDRDQRMTEFGLRLYSNEPALQLSGIRYFRERLAVPTNAPTEMVFNTGIIPRLVHALKAELAGGSVVNAPGKGYVNPIYDANALGPGSLIIRLNPHVLVGSSPPPSGTGGDRVGGYVSAEKYFDTGVLDPTPLLSSMYTPTATEELEYAQWLAEKGTAAASEANTSASTLAMHNKISHLLQYEAAWTLSLIACGDQQKYGLSQIEAGLVPVIVDLLAYTPHNKVREACLMCVGNLSAFVQECRDLFLQQNVTTALMWQLGLAGAPPHRQNASPSIATIENVAWSLDNLAKGNPPPAPEYSIQTIEVLAYLLHSPVDYTVMAVLSTLQTLCESVYAAQNIDSLMESGVLRRVYELCRVAEDVKPIMDMMASPHFMAFAQHGGEIETGGHPLGDADVQAIQHRLAALMKSSATRATALRVLCDVLRSPVHMHRRVLLSVGKFPLLLELLLWEMGGDTLTLQNVRIPNAEGAPTRSVWSPLPTSAGLQDKLAQTHTIMKADSKVDLLLTLASVVEGCDDDDMAFGRIGAMVPSPVTAGAVAASLASASVSADIMVDGPKKATYLQRLLSGGLLDILYHSVELHASHVLDRHITQFVGGIILKRTFGLQVQGVGGVGEFSADKGGTEERSRSGMKMDCSSAALQLLFDHSIGGKIMLILSRIACRSCEASSLEAYGAHAMLPVLMTLRTLLAWARSGGGIGYGEAEGVGGTARDLLRHVCLGCLGALHQGGEGDALLHALGALSTTAGVPDEVTATAEELEANLKAAMLEWERELELGGECRKLAGGQ